MMNLPLKILLVERRQANGCLMRALQGDFAAKFQWRRVSSENELRLVAREYGATVVLSADDMQGRTQHAVAQMLRLLSPQAPQVMICEIGDGSTAWGSTAEPPLPEIGALQPEDTPQSGVPAPAAAELAHMLQASPDAVVMLDAEGWISEINDRALRLLGSAAREGLKSKLHVQDLIGALRAASAEDCPSLPLVAVNLDGLPTLNAQHGTHYGNAIIDLIASVVQPQFARCGLLARLGSNQYLAVLPHLSPAADAAAAVSGDRQWSADGDLTALFGEATANDAQIAAAPRRTGADFGHDLQREALSVHFQPQYDLRSGRGCGVEALARWTLSDGRTLGPGLFIPIAERTGTIEALDAWILEKACACARAWRGRDAERLTLSVNVSNRQLSASFSRTLASVLEKSGIAAGRLELEIDEGLILAGHPAAIECLRQWKHRGHRIAVNHRSANYSSLAYLSSVAVDRLKLDKGMIHRMCHDRGIASMVRAIIALGAAMGVDVIAEGVEAHDQLEMLQSFGCRHAQGYLLARPMPVVQAQLALRKTWGNLRPNVAAAAVARRVQSAAIHQPTAGRVAV